MPEMMNGGLRYKPDCRHASTCQLPKQSITKPVTMLSEKCNLHQLPTLLMHDVVVVGTGRPIDSARHSIFEKLCDWLEVADEELYTLAELQDRMKEIGASDDVYSIKRLKRKLIEHYEDHILFSEISGKKNVICFHDMAKRIISNKWYNERENNFTDESHRIVIAAAKLIKAEIRDALYNHDEYPLSPDYDNVKRAKEWLPSLLNVFMEHVVGSELKQVAVSQAIVQAARPKSVISPILFGLGVSVDHSFGSKWLLDSLSRFGFSVSYDEVNLYKQSVIQSHIPDLPQSYPDSFTQWSADNVDHNVVTLDGSNTFHGMGIISMSTPFNASHLERGSFLELPVQRISRVKSADLVRNKSIPNFQLSFILYMKSLD